MVTTKGATGEQGMPGIQGKQGIQGLTGTTGPMGATGEQGMPGIMGNNGSPGAPGSPGSQGIQGIKGATGQTGPSGGGATGTMPVLTVATITSPTYSVIAMNQLLKFNCTPNSIVVTMPLASIFTGQSITLERIDSVITNLLTINPSGTNTINSTTSLIITIQNDSVNLVSDGTNWNVIGDRALVALKANESDLLITNGNVLANTASILANSLIVTNYFIAGQTNASTMLASAVTAAMANGMPYRNIYLPAGLYPVIEPFTIPDGITFIGCGNSSVIQPNYALWQGTDYRAVIVRGREGSSLLGYYSYNRIVGNFTVTAINAGTVKATGVFFGTDQVITWEQSVAYSVYNATIQNILVEYVDTAFYMQEAWQCNFINISCMYCREGAAVIGKVVNCNFLVNFQNFSMLNATPNTAYANTSDLTDNGIGIMIDQKTYSDTVGRPEGLVILPGTLVFGAQNNIIINNILELLVDGCMFDSAKNECMIVSLPDGLYVRNCYMATNATLASGINCVSLIAGQTSAYSKNVFNNCEIVGYASGGGSCGLSASVRFDLDIIDCDFQGFAGINGVIYLYYCHCVHILNNHGHNNKVVFVNVGNYCENSRIDGNTSEDNFDILHCMASTSQTCFIGKNQAAIYTGGAVTTYNSTYFAGKITIAASAYTATITPFLTLLGTTAFIYPLVKFTVYNNTANNPVSWAYVASTGVITFTTTSTSAITIYAEITAMPFLCW